MCWAVKCCALERRWQPMFARQTVRGPRLSSSPNSVVPARKPMKPSYGLSCFAKTAASTLKALTPWNKKPPN